MKKHVLYPGAGLAICILLGIVIGAAVDNVPMGLVMGIVFGTVFAGAARRKQDDTKTPEE